MKKFLFPIAGFIIAFVLSSAIPTKAEELTPEGNCLHDWHPPPCGTPEPPKAVSDKDKAKARKLQIYYAGNAAFLQTIAIGGFLIGGPVGGSGPQIVSVVASYKALAWGWVHSDPWDPDFQSSYDGWWRGAEELGLWYTESYWLNELVGIAEQIVFYADFVYVSANRATSCQMAGADCFDWQKARVDWGLAQMSEVMRRSAYYLWGAADATIAEGSSRDLAQKLAEMGDVSYWWGYADE